MYSDPPFSVPISAHVILQLSGLMHSFISPDQFNLLIFDEAQRAKKNYACANLSLIVFDLIWDRISKFSISLSLTLRRKQRFPG